MRQMIFYVFILFFKPLETNIDKCNLGNKQLAQEKNGFKLQFTTVGFGPNMFEMQPVFRVKDTKYIYTSEEVWIFPDNPKIQQDTLCKGDFRISSIDSISNLIEGIKDSVVYKANTHITDGAVQYIEIRTESKKVSFQLHNASDSIAGKIMQILNSYIPDSYKKLWLSDFPAK